MIFDFSIDTTADKIQNTHTKDYFKEVHQTFVNGNYRSATVMLYSVLICDLVYKLRDLRDVYNDSKAENILKDIEKLQNANSKSPEWESKLIDFIKDRTNLLEPSDIVTIDTLQQFRHLSAHPVLTNSDLLFSPNKETVQSLIRNILEGVLIQPPYFSNKVFDIILEDLEDIKDTVISEAKLEHYLTSRYFKRLKDAEIKTIFRSLWKIIFISENERAEENQEINLRAIEILIVKYKSICLESIKVEPNYYSKVKRKKNINILVYLIAKYPEIYLLIEQSLKILIEETIEQDDTLRFIAWFVNEDIKKHIEDLKYGELDEIKENAVELMNDLCKANDLQRSFLNFCIKYFVASSSYASTWSRYHICIQPHIEDFSIKQIKALLKASNVNNQIYNRNNMKPKLRAIAERFEGEIDIDEYQNISN